MDIRTDISIYKVASLLQITLKNYEIGNLFNQQYLLISYWKGSLNNVFDKKHILMRILGQVRLRDV